MARLAGKVALVTGASSGIGAEVVKLFAAEGAEAYGCGRSDDKSLGDHMEYLHLDVTDEEEWKSAVSRIIERHGRLDVLVNNAGMGTYEGIAEAELDNWNDVIAVNQTATFLGMREVIPVMRAKGGGSIINVASTFGSRGVPGAAAYQSAKGAILAMSRNAAVTYAGDRIRVNSLIPGITDTPIIERQDANMTAGVIAATPLGRVAEPIEIAYGCVYLASDESTFTTGSELVIDGGYLAQ